MTRSRFTEVTTAGVAALHGQVVKVSRWHPDDSNVENITWGRLIGLLPVSSIRDSSIRDPGDGYASGWAVVFDQGEGPVAWDAAEVGSVTPLLVDDGRWTWEPAGHEVWFYGEDEA